METALVVGSGATGALTAAMLASKAMNLSVTVWDKGSGVGGRMTTRRNEPGYHQIDLGAQYITRTRCGGSDHSVSTELKDQIFEELVSNGVLVPFRGRIEGEINRSHGDCINYVSPSGTSSIPRYFLDKFKLNCINRRQLTTVNVNQSTGQVVCEWNQDGSHNEQTFDSLILTLPIPQLLNLGGNLTGSLSQGELDRLRSVQYSSRYAMALGYDDPIPDIPWTAKYCQHPIIRYVCWDHLKRNQPSSKPSLLVHTSVPFGIEHLEENKEVVSSIITSALPDVIPHLPSPSFTYIIRWRYSQVLKPYVGTPGCVVLHKRPLVIATGDAFTHSNLEGCITAANVTTETVLDNVNRSNKEEK